MNHSLVNHCIEQNIKDLTDTYRYPILHLLHCLKQLNMLLGRRSFPFKVSCNPGGPFLPCLELPPGIVGHAGCGGELLIGNKSLRFSIEKKSLDLRIVN